MGRWIALVILTVLYRYISSEQLIDTSHNDRPTRQLDFEDSCSCEDLDKSHSRRDVRYDDALDAGTEDVFLRSRDLDDCPCRFRDTDSEGAPSILFPSAMRSAETFLRPADKKQEPKPIFNPEVDLASSVLETLRIVTDEEYEDALARDAAKSAARAVENDLFGDAVPQESANLFTIVVNPKASDTNDIEPEASHIKQSRCIHPLEGASNPSLTFNNRMLSKIRPSILNRNFYDMDSNVGASSIHEHVMPLDEEMRESSTNTLSSNTDFKSTALNNDVDENYKLPFKSFSLQNKLRKFDLASSPLLRSIRDKTMNSLSHLPKSKTRQNLLLEKVTDNNDDLNPAPSAVQEQVEKRIPYYRTNSKYENIKQNSRPLSLPNLLNLKDVELIPLKDLLSKQATKSKAGTVFPSLYDYADDVYSRENLDENTEGWKKTRLTLINDTIEDNSADPDSSPSLINLHVSSKNTETANDNCLNEQLGEEIHTKESENRPFSTGRLKTLPTIGNMPPKLTILDDINCVEDNYEQDFLTDASNNSPNRIGQTEARSIENQNMQSDYSNGQDTENISESRKKQNNLQPKLLDPISIDKTISSIKNYILRKQDDLKNKNTNLKNKKSFKQENEDILITTVKNQDCENEALTSVTTIMPDYSNNDLGVPENLKLNKYDAEPGIYKLNKPEAALPSIIENDDADTLIENETKDTPSWITSPLTLINDTFDNSIHDSDSSASLLNLQVISKNMQIIDDSENSERIALPTNSIEAVNAPLSTESRDSTDMKHLLPKVALGNEGNCVDAKNSDQDSITDISNNYNIIDEPEARTLENENIHLEYSDARDIRDSNESNNIPKHSKQQLLDPNSIDKTISSIKNYILKKQEDLKNLKTNMKNKNMFKQENKDMLVTTEKNQDNENEVTTTLKSNILNDNLEIFPTTIPNLPDNSEDVTASKSYESDAAIDNAGDCTGVSMQDLQIMSDSMLQKEERELNNIEYNNPSEKVIESLESRRSDSGELDLDNSANTPTETIVKPVNLDTFQEKTIETNNCNTDLASRLTDNHADPSDIVISSIPRENDIHSVPILQTKLNPTNNLLKNPLSDKLKLPPLDPKPIVDDVRGKLMDLFIASERDVPDISPPTLKSHSESSDILNPIMATDASVANFQSRKPPLGFSDGINFDILKLRPESSIFPDFLKFDSPTKSLKAKKINFDPFDLKSTLEDHRLNIDKSVLKSTLRESKDLDDILNIRPSLHDLRDRFIDPSGKARNNMHSTLKHSKNAFESKFRKLNNNNYDTLRNPIINSQNLLDTISQNSEDINDKLRALHVDFNDRLESVRNDLIDRSKLLSSGSRGTKPILRSASNLHNKNKAKQPKHSQGSARDSKKTATRKETSARFNSSPKTLDKKKLKMPVAASVPVPRTVQVPELKATSVNSSPLTLRKASSLIPNADEKISKDFTRNFGEKPNNSQNTLLRNNNNLGKDKTIKIFISTTPRPENYNGYKFRSFIPQTNKGQLETRKMYDDHRGSPSEIKPTKVSVPEDNYRISNLDNDDGLLSNRLVSTEYYPQKASRTALLKPTKVSVPDYDRQDKYRISHSDNDDKLLSNRLVSTENYPQQASKNALQSWPRATESAFLYKVKEAVKARLANGNPTKFLKTIGEPDDKAKENKESDMARSASENQEIFDTSLKEHVPYKCKMICTKE